MRKLLIPIVATLALGALPTAGFAQTGAQQGAADGANTGGQILGPLGAAVGAVTGAAVGGAADIAGAVTAPLAPAPGTTIKHTTCVTDTVGNRRCDSTVETTE